MAQRDLYVPVTIVRNAIKQVARQEGFYTAVQPALKHSVKSAWIGHRQTLWESTLHMKPWDIFRKASFTSNVRNAMSSESGTLVLDLLCRPRK